MLASSFEFRNEEKFVWKAYLVEVCTQIQLHFEMGRIFHHSNKVLSRMDLLQL